MGERTRWTDEEWARIVQLATPLIIEHPDWTIITCVQKIADKAIAPDRMRNIPNIGSIRADIRHKLESLRKPSDDPEVGLLKEQLRNAQAIIDEANKRIKSLLEDNTRLQGLNQSLASRKIPSEREVIVGFLGEILGEALAIKEKRLEPRIEIITNICKDVPGATDEVDPSVAKPPKHDPDPSPGVRKPRIVIIGGPTPSQHELHREFGDDLAIRFYQGSNDRHRIGDELRAFKDKSHGKIIVWTDYCGHGPVQSLKSYNIPFEPFTGKINALKDRLRKIVSGGGPAR